MISVKLNTVVVIAAVTNMLTNRQAREVHHTMTFVGRIKDKCFKYRIEYVNMGIMYVCVCLCLPKDS